MIWQTSRRLMFPMSVGPLHDCELCELATHQHIVKLHGSDITYSSCKRPEDITSKEYGTAERMKVKTFSIRDSHGSS